MNFTKFDIVMTATMALAVISMSFVMPALGLTSASTSESDIPEFSVEGDAFDIVGEMPENPGTPGKGTLTLQNNDVEGSQNVLNLEDDVTMALLQDSNVSDPEMQVTLDNLSSTSSVYFNESSVGDFKTFNDFGYEIDLELERVLNENQSDFTWSVNWQLKDQPSGDKGFLERIPIVGGAVDAAQALAQVVGWIGSVIWWGIATIFEIAINVVVMIGQTMLFMIDTATWLITTYGEIVSSVSSWASLFVAVPGLILFLELSKAVMIGISLLPTT